MSGTALHGILAPSAKMSIVRPSLAACEPSVSTSWCCHKLCTSASVCLRICYLLADSRRGSSGFCRVSLFRGHGFDLGPLPPGLIAAQKKLLDAVKPVLGPPFFEFLGAGSLLLTKTRHGTALLLCCMHIELHAMQDCR
jgi:hypothetical protein